MSEKGLQEDFAGTEREGTGRETGFLAWKEMGRKTGNKKNLLKIVMIVRHGRLRSLIRSIYSYVIIFKLN